MSMSETHKTKRKVLKMLNIAEWLMEEQNKNNPYAIDTFMDFTANGVKLYPTFCKRCNMFTEIHNVAITEEQRKFLHAWLCRKIAKVNHHDLINKLASLA